LILAAQAVDSRDDSALLMSADDVERAMEHVGTYHLEVARTIVTFLRENWNPLNEESRTRLLKEASIPRFGLSSERTNPCSH